MKHWIALSGIVLLGIAAVVVCERRKVDVQPGPAAVLYLIADTEQELTRMPVNFTRMSDADEIRIGDQIARFYGEAQQDKKDAETLEVERYLTQVGSRLATRAHRKLPYRFHYIPDHDLVNAFALPGGHVYVGAGLLALMDSEDELASVLGHEIEHIDHYHCAERVQREQALRRIPFGGLVSLPMEVFEAGYSKDQEMEADREGTRLSVQSGYSPNGAIRMFEMFQRLYDESHGKAHTPQEELTQVTLQTLEGYFRSHPLPQERIEQIQKLIASERWEVRTERDLAVAYVFLTARAKIALEAKKYEQAQRLAERSLQIHSDQSTALETLAKAQFAQAEFADSAKSYRRILDTTPSRRDLAERYALALAAADRKTAAAEFRAWAHSTGQEDALRLLLAELSLVAGNTGPAKEAMASATSSSEDSAPDQLGQLGWWYYLAGDFATADDLLERAVQQRPGDLDYSTHRAWVDLEQQRYADALQILNSSYSSGTERPEREMARAVAMWLSQEKDTALEHYQTAVASQPEWNNPRWVRALYSPLVASTVEKMRLENELRMKKLNRRQPPPS